MPPDVQGGGCFLREIKPVDGAPLLCPIQVLIGPRIDYDNK